ncbi:MAG TPA: HAD family hydrolase [Candidatus Cloacimonadota bacterium]|jgi:D,D-heptose 1,7-bisphosphate phosphatase|nr:HAD family hydrolase [Candidatus Cloacimonadales bacterium]HPY96507.1 HAD family hydrolase [Candidatus Cloacimonadota bacterium]HQB41170.1 HAD family hydrolase [Candidatus Cloacimonadota bacterium]
MITNKAVLIDRDGTINLDEKGYISKPEDFNIFPFASSAINLLNKLGYKVLVVSNQSGIARGYFTEQDLQLIHNKMIDELKKDNAFIDKAYYCPYYHDAVIPEYKQNLEMRKPELGMFYQALKEYDFHIKSSFMIGDKQDDIIFGKNAGLTSILVMTGKGMDALSDLEKWKIKPDYIAENLLVASQLISHLTKNKK